MKSKVCNFTEISLKGNLNCPWGLANKLKLQRTIIVTPQANLTSTKHERDVRFVRGDPHPNWQDTFCSIWEPQEQNRMSLVKVQSKQYLVRFVLGHDTHFLAYQLFKQCVHLYRILSRIRVNICLGENRNGSTPLIQLAR